MSVLIGHASGDENGGARGGMAGDQTGREVCTRSWYRGGWNVVLRPKRAAVAEKMARTCEIICNGNLAGYDQYQRNTLRSELRKLGWDASKLTTPCETDCSALMTACAEAAGVNVAYTKTSAGGENAPVTQNMRQRFFATGEFDVLLDRQYTDSDDYLLRGDVLVRESGHTAMALSNGDKATPRKDEDDMTGEEIYKKLIEYLAEKPAPDWAKAELQEAMNTGITDGAAPMTLIPRYQAAIMAKRAVDAAIKRIMEDV